MCATACGVCTKQSTPASFDFCEYPSKMYTKSSPSSLLLAACCKSTAMTRGLPASALMPLPRPLDPAGGEPLGNCLLLTRPGFSLEAGNVAAEEEANRSSFKMTAETIAEALSAPASSSTTRSIPVASFNCLSSAASTFNSGQVKNFFRCVGFSGCVRSSAWQRKCIQM